MYEVHSGEQIVDGKAVRTWKRELVSACTMEIEAGTTGYQGGDSGHGCRTFIRLKNTGGTDIECRLLGRNGSDGVEIALGGDCELGCLLDALKFIRQVLKKQIKEVERYGHTVS